MTGDTQGGNGWYNLFVGYWALYPFRGRIDEVRAFDRELTGDELLAIVNAAPALPSGNLPPSVPDVEVMTVQDIGMAIPVTLTAYDPEGDALSYDLDASVLQGTLSGTAPELFYMPPDGWSGTDALTFSVSDGTNPPVESIARIEVLSCNRPPEVIGESAFTVRKGETLRVSLQAEDRDGDPLAWQLESAPEGAHLDEKTGLLVWYAPVVPPDSTDFIVSVTDNRSIRHSRVFMTSAFGGANIGAWPLAEGVNGVAGGDKVCQALADSAGLGGTWMAMLSATYSDFLTRSVHSTEPYVLPNGLVLADNWDHLLPGNIFRLWHNKLNITEAGDRVPDRFLVQTGTGSDGRYYKSQTIQGGYINNGSDWTEDSNWYIKFGTYPFRLNSWGGDGGRWSGWRDGYDWSRAALFAVEQVPISSVTQTLHVTLVDAYEFTVTSVAPTLVTAGAIVTVTGSGFGYEQGDGWVSFDGRSAAVLSWSDAEIIVAAPSGHPGGPANLIVRRNDGNESVLHDEITMIAAPSTHTVTFDLDGKGERVGGGALVQQVPHGGAAVAPEVEALPDWTFTGWDRSFGNVTGPMTVKALYDAILIPLPDLSLSAADLRILNAAGAETWNPAVGEAVTVEVTLRNTGEAATSGDILVQLFLDGAPANLAAYDTNDFTIAASTVVAESMGVDGSRTLLLPWTATGPDRVATLTAVAEFAANRVQSQANAEGIAAPLPVVELSFANNSVGRSIQIGSPAAGEYGIAVEAEAPADMVSGVSYTLTGTAHYDWGANEPVLGAAVTVTVSNQIYTARTTAPDGTWSVALPGLPEGNHPALVQVHDGRMTGSTTLTLSVSAGPETRDLRILDFGFVSGAYHAEGQTAYAVTGESLVLRARVRNDGNAPCGPFDVAFRDPSGATFATTRVDGLAAFSQTWVTAPSGWTVEAGTHQLSALADSANEIEETNEHNNDRACTVIGTAALPDLAVIGIGFAPGGSKAGDTVTISAVIENRGAAAVAAGTSFDVLFSVNGVEVATETVAPLSDPLASGAGLTVSTTHTFAEHGAFTVGVLADSGDDIDETREDNNALGRTLTVRQALPDLRPWTLRWGWQQVSGLSFSPSQPVADEPVTVLCDIYNVGTVPVPAGAAFDVTFSADGAPFATTRVNIAAELAVGASIRAEAVWPGGPAGTVAFAAAVDTAEEIAEENEANNTTARSLTLYPNDVSLVAAGLAFTPWQPLPGSAVILTATIRNDGGAPGGAGMPVTFYAGAVAPENQIGSVSLAADIAPKGGTGTAALEWTAPAEAGQVEIFAMIGASGTQRVLTVTAHPAPNLQVFSEDIAFDPPLPNSGDTVTVSATVRNTEGSEATGFQVLFFVESSSGQWVELGLPVTVASLPVGTGVTVNATAAINAERSAYTVKVEIEPNPAQGDANPGDNAATSSFLLADTPRAEAGPDAVCFVGQTIQFDGSGSANAVNYAWTMISAPAGSTAELTGAQTATPSLMPYRSGIYELQLVVDNGIIPSAPDTVRLTVSWLTLEITSPHGEPVPATGLHNFAWATEVACQSTAVDEVDPHTQYVCLGWTGTGSVPPEGGTTNVSFAITNHSTLAWQWGTNYWLEVAAAGNGTVDVESGWQAAGSNVVLTATPDADHRFTGWSGDTNDCVIVDAEITVPMTGPRALAATFVSALHTVTLRQGLYGQIDGADGDGVYIATVSYGDAFPDVMVTPSAGFLFAGWMPEPPAIIEADFDTDARYRPTDDVIAMAVAEVLASDELQQTHGLYTPATLRHLFPSPLMIAVDPDTGEVRLDLQMQWTDDLAEGDWQSLGAPVEWRDTPPPGRIFYRLIFNPDEE